MKACRSLAKSMKKGRGESLEVICQRLDEKARILYSCVTLFNRSS